MKKFILQLVCLAVWGGGQLHAEPAIQTRIVSSAEESEAQTIRVAPHCVASTVGLVSTAQDGNRFSVTSGSGVIVSSDGLILTAGHVIQKPGNKLTVRLVDGRVLAGVAIGLDHAADTGLARITDPAPAGGWAFCPMAPDDSARVGEWVLATGNPGSIVVDRDPPLRLGRITRHTADLIGSNCAIEPGDSGGPLFDLSGRVVGIHSRIFTTNGPFSEYFSVHVPISDFSRQWKDLLAGMNANPDVNLDSRSERPRPNPGLGAGARAALNQLASQNDPEAVAALADEKKNSKLTLSPGLMTRLLKLAAENDRAGIKPSTAPAQTADAVGTNPPTTTPTTQPAPQAGIAHELRAKAGPQLKQNLLQQHPNAIISDALLDRMMDRATYNAASGKIDVAPIEQELREMGVVAENKPGSGEDVLSIGRVSAEAGKTSLLTLSQFALAMNTAGDCVVEIRDGNQPPVLLGAIIDSDGWIVSKASDLPASPRVILPDGRIFRAKVVGKDSATDLALLKVNATSLNAVKFTDAAPLGEWLIALTANSDNPAIGLVSLTARPIGQTFSHFQGEQKIVLGVGFSGTNCIITQIAPGMPAEAAGMKTGDEIFQLNGKPISNHDAFIAELKNAKPGDTLSIMVHRAGQDLELKPVIGQAKAATQTASGVGEADNVAGGKLSKRRTNFPLAIQTDTAVWADECGGPLINLHGQTVGIIIARYDRACTFALPAQLVQATIAKLKGAN